MGTHMQEANWAQWTPFYMTALQTSRLSFDSPRDMFGNARIPDISLLDTSSNPSIQPHDWHLVKSHSNLTYISLLGVPIVDIPKLGNISLTVESAPTGRSVADSGAKGTTQRSALAPVAKPSHLIGAVMKTRILSGAMMTSISCSTTLQRPT
jgi:hypothetical protein